MNPRSNPAGMHQAEAVYRSELQSEHHTGYACGDFSSEQVLSGTCLYPVLRLFSISYLCEVRIKASRELLASTDYSITEVAQLSGFSSQSYFAQCFQKYCRMTASGLPEKLPGKCGEGFLKRPVLKNHAFLQPGYPASSPDRCFITSSNPMLWEAFTRMISPGFSRASIPSSSSCLPGK